MPDAQAPDATVAGCPRIRRAFTVVGLASLALVTGSVVLLGVALALGVHCPECDRPALGEAYPWWRAYFGAIHVLRGAGAVGGLSALLVARRRRWGAIAFVVAVLIPTPA